MRAAHSTVGRQRHDEWQLPSTFLHEGETLADAARRALPTKVDVEGVQPVQLVALDDPGRDGRGCVLSVAHLDVVPFGRLGALANPDIRLTPVTDTHALAFDHNPIVELAIDRLRAE